MSYSLNLLHVKLPDEVLKHPSIQNFTGPGADFILIHNDIHSYNVERAYGIHGHNLVTMVMKEKILGVQAALSNLSKFTPEKEDSLKVYCASVLRWPVTMDEWSFMSERYFGSERF
ncbi:hypothetical protein M422DRAFT_262914 [Sphaerobolus stellatus SS14]|uniref:Unplaced genomic scaffold SPHSTscaffold_119, whole genome shotgun sequence n=1 Tax=Sphaerobolus stellatus (strain SS14) TaxID=990650 RepID=A0A0C9VCC6_SPHS4|nr:hypothetical protein M422DRAFT_262914 [Sphaerobolus stellatus SS14]